MINKIYSRNATPSGLIFMWQRMKTCPIMKEVKNTKGTRKTLQRNYFKGFLKMTELEKFSTPDDFLDLSESRLKEWFIDTIEILDILIKRKELGQVFKEECLRLNSILIAMKARNINRVFINEKDDFMFISFFYSGKYNHVRIPLNCIYDPLIKDKASYTKQVAVFLIKYIGRMNAKKINEIEDEIDKYFKKKEG